MTGELICFDGTVYRMPNTLSWWVLRTGGVPCDAFSITCLYDGKLREVLPTAYRFAAYEGDTLVLRGVVDSWQAESGTEGLRLTVEGRGMAALLLDNEAEAVEYQGVTLEEILRNHAAPWGITWGDVPALRWAGAYRVESGSSQWKALSGFTGVARGFTPHFTHTGILELRALAGSGESRLLDSSTPVLSCRLREERYGVISEMLVKDKSRGIRHTARNEAFLGRGGSRRQVLYLPAAGNLSAMRYTGAYQIQQSERGKRQLEMTVAGGFAAQPGDVVQVRYWPLDISGSYDVVEADSRGDAGGVTTTLVMEERS